MKIMLFTDIPPCKNFTAGIVLNKMCDFLLDAGHEVCCFAVKHTDVNAEIPEDKLSRMQFQIVKKPRESFGAGALKGIRSVVGNISVALLSLPQIMRQAGNFAKKNQADLIWSVVQGQTMIKLAEPVARYAKKPYVIQVWDPPEWWLMENCVDRYTTGSVMKAFGKALRHAECCISASWAMADEYCKRFSCEKAIPVILGFSPERVIPNGEKNKNQFVIALSGQLYAIEEFYALMAALNQMQWTYQGKQIVVRLYGIHFNLYASVPSHLELRGWLDQASLLPELADADILYCPYWFGLRYKEPSSLSFPSKLSTYLKTGVPVLMHGPEYASPRRFLEKYNAGYICGSMDPTEIKKILMSIMDEPEENRRAVAQQGYLALTNNLTEEHMRRAFFQSLGLPDERE